MASLLSSLVTSCKCFGCSLQQNWRRSGMNTCVFLLRSAHLFWENIVRQLRQLQVYWSITYSDYMYLNQFAWRASHINRATKKLAWYIGQWYHVIYAVLDVLLEKGEIKAKEIWDIYRKAPRIPQVCISFASIIFFVAWYLALIFNYLRHNLLYMVDIAHMLPFTFSHMLYSSVQWFLDESLITSKE